MARGAASGGFGALVGTLMTEAMVDDKTPVATAQRITQLSDLITTTLALAAGLDPVSAYAASRNANEHNALQHLGTLKELGIVKEGEEVYEGDEPEKTEGQKQFEKGLQKHIKEAVKQARQTRRVALTKEDHDFIVAHASKQYARAYWASKAPGLVVEYGLTAASYIPGTTGLVVGVADAAYGYGTGRYDAMDVAQTVVSSSMGVLKAAKPFVGVAKGTSKLDQAVSHLSSSTFTPSKMPACMVKSHNPKADVFKRVARDDWDVSTRVKLFGTDHVHLFKADRVRKVGDARPRNFEFAGDVFKFDKQYLSKRLKDVTDVAERREIIKDYKVLQSQYPHGVPFTGSGFPDFSRYAAKKVEIQVTGNRAVDFAEANKAMRWKKEPADFTWHHHEDGKTMLLVPFKLHDSVKHTGSVAIMKGAKK